MVIWLFVSTPLSTIIAGALGGGVTFWRIRHVHKRVQWSHLEDDRTLHPRYSESLCNQGYKKPPLKWFTMMVSPKAKRKPKARTVWSSIPHLRIYIGALVAAVLLAIGISMWIVPVREVRVPGFITPNANQFDTRPTVG